MEITRTFTSKEVVRLCSITMRQVQYWCEQDALHPVLRKNPFVSRVFTFEDLMLVMVLKRLRRSHIRLKPLHRVMVRRDSNRYLISDGTRFTWRNSEAEVLRLFTEAQSGRYLIDVGQIESELASRMGNAAVRSAGGAN